MRGSSLRSVPEISDAGVAAGRLRGVRNNACERGAQYRERLEMSHIPVNHPLRGFYRFLATLTGLYVLVFGVVGFTEASGTPAFSQDHLHWVLGLRTNLAFAELSVVAGAIILAAAVIGRNLDRFVNVGGGVLFMAAGMLMLILMR